MLMTSANVEMPGTALRVERTLVAQLRDEIVRLIAEHAMAPGDKLPTEAQLTARFGVSRQAVREAFKLLEQDGLIYVQHGAGRFVSPVAAVQVERPITCFESVTEMARHYGYRPVNKVLSVAEEPAPREVAAALRLDAAEKVIHLERLRLHKDEVILYCVDWVPRRLLPDRLFEIDWTGSLVELLTQRGHRPTMSAAKASAVLLPPDVMDRNDLHDFGPAFLITETCHAADGTPVIYARDYHRGSAFSFSFIRK